MHGLIFNHRHGLLICTSCCIGLPLTSVATHLSYPTVRTWDDSTGKWVEFKAEHPRLIGVNNSKQRTSFKTSLVKNLIKHRIITSAAGVLDGSSNAKWRANGDDRICTDGTPVQGVRTNLGYVCDKCPAVGRSLMFLKNHKHRSGPDKGMKARPADVIGPVQTQTFTETYRRFYLVHSDPSFLPKQTDHTATQFPALQLLANEQTEMLKTIPDMKSLGPELRRLPPIFRDGGIEPWLRLFDRRQLSSMLPQIPNSGTQMKTSRYSKLRNAVFQLFAEDLHLLQDGNINIEIPHIITNGSRLVSYSYFLLQINTALY